MTSPVELTFLSRVAFHGREITAPRVRGLLALLAGELRGGCSVGRLVDGLWGEELPADPANALRILVSRARALVGSDVIVSTPTGYRLALAAERVDTAVVVRCAEEAARAVRGGDHAAALAAAEEGLGCWDAPPEAEGVPGDPVAELRAARAPVYGDLVRARALALARVGRRAEAAAPLAQLLAGAPRDEEVLAELLRAEAASAGPAAALARYDTYRRGLRDDLGTGPGAALRAVHQELLRAEAPAVRHGVPHDPNPLLGRDDDLAAADALLRSSRLTSIVGPGGLGKTRLAYAVSRRAEQQLVHVVSLAGVRADADVAGEVASALGGAAPPGADVLAAIVAALGGRPALLVLDNCEQVVGGAADLVRDLLTRAADLRVLVTSRAPLGLSSEAVYHLPQLTPETSAELFAQRARAARPDVDLPPAAVAELCRHLDGLPLAVELAAARVRVLSVPEIARRLGDRFALLRGGARDAPERHRTLHAVVDWSWNLLEEDARAALRALSVFPGGFTAEAAHRMVDGGDALELLEQLVDQSLLKAADTAAGIRFHMLETVREFSAARRAAAGEEEAVTARFLDWARDFGVAQHDALFGPEPLRHWPRLRAEQDNLVLALRYALARADHATTAAAGAVLAGVWTTDSASFHRTFTLAADTARPLSHYRPDPRHTEVVRTLSTLCTAAPFMGYGPLHPRHLVVLRRLPPAGPDTLLRATAVVLCAVPDMRPPDYEELLELCASDAPLLSGIAECVASYLWEHGHEPERALAAARRMLAAVDAVPNPSLKLLGGSRCSELCMEAGLGEEAYGHLMAALDALSHLSDQSPTTGLRRGLVLACLQRGRTDEAEEWLRRVEEARSPAEQPQLLAADMAAWGEIALSRGLTELGLKRWRTAVEKLRSAGPPEAPYPPVAAPAAPPVGAPPATLSAAPPDAAPGRLPDALPDAETMPPPDPLADSWGMHIAAAAVAAHAYAGRLEPVAGLVAELERRMRTVLSDASRPGGQVPAEASVDGTAVLSLGLVRLAAGDLAAGDVSAVRLLALAERLYVPQAFHPTLAVDRARRTAEDADGAAYADAVSEYAALDRDELREVARGLIAATSRRG
ncbi:BTAD domain-containing putative transcriptional regulator [Streptomyces sp. WMMC500]|uniref:ATP-binding protein n=1 Tax=Streptomyces sp. WMMC500 TaxID=3015154 RepID=UPI00248BCAB2|nr:BTAD domain-containing putative transcriptional regulator [Streptomyces sp. WMMC500]WBB63809.1 BTAD domain-containing putative transcriptional regulator [Streptomyces sp. WMMC500]